MKRRHKEIHKALKEAGAVLLRSKNHEVWRLPNGKRVVVFKSPSDHRNLKNTLSDIRRAQRGS